MDEVSRIIHEILRPYTALSFALIQFIMVVVYTFRPKFHLNSYITQNSTSFQNSLFTFPKLGTGEGVCNICHSQGFFFFI